MRTLYANFFIGLLALFLSSAINAAAIYKWVDSNGTVHFGSEPPANTAVEIISTKVAKPQPLPEASASQKSNAKSETPSQEEIDKQVRKQVAQEQEQLTKQCTEMRIRLSQLKNNPRLLTEIDGETIRLSEDQRQERIKETEQKIKEFCN